MPSWNKKQRQEKIKNILLNISIFSFVVFILGFLFLYFGQVKKFEVRFVDENKNTENLEISIQKYLDKENIINKNFLFLNKNNLEKYLKEEFHDISKISISRKINSNLYILVYKHKAFFYSCNDDFVIGCAYGDEDGMYYKELENKAEIGNIIEIETSIKNFDGEKNTDTFIGNKILSPEKFNLLKELKKYFEKQNIRIDKIKIDEFQTVSFFSSTYFTNSIDFYLKVSLNKSFVETVKDFETLEKSVEFGNVLKNKNSNLLYLDLSFKDKVFYK